MSTRVSAFLAFILLLNSLGFAGEKKKTILPDYVLQAHTVAVIINPGSETPLLNPGENRQAQDDVERALTKWGRLRPVMDAAQPTSSSRCEEEGQSALRSQVAVRIVRYLPAR